MAFSPALSMPLASPGITVVLPLLNSMTPGARLDLWHIDPATGLLQPATDAFHNTPVLGTVNKDGVSATFLNVVTLSTVVAHLRTAASWATSITTAWLTARTFRCSGPASVSERANLDLIPMRI